MVRLLKNHRLATCSLETSGADLKLLLGILKTQNVKVDREAITQFMATENAKPTASSIQNCLKKLKEMNKGG